MATGGKGGATGAPAPAKKQEKTVAEPVKISTADATRPDVVESANNLTAAAAPTTIPAKADGDPARATLVVVCPQKSRDLFKRMWARATDAVTVFLDYTGRPVADLVAELVAREDIAEHFVLSPAFVCPTSPLTVADLEIIKAREVDGRLSYHTYLPVALDKDKIVETFEAMSASGERDFLSVYHRLAAPDVLPLVVSNTGTFVGYVMRPAPDFDQVEKALAERKFLACNDVGFSAVEKLLAKRYGR